MKMKIKSVSIVVKTEDNVTMQRSISSKDLNLNMGSLLNSTYQKILSELKKRYKDET